MPCDTIRTNSVDLASIGRIDADLLASALNQLGIRCTVGSTGTVKYISGSNVNWQPGQDLNLYRGASGISLDQVKQAYSAEVIKSTAKRYGWTLKQTAQFKFQVVKR